MSTAIVLWRPASNPPEPEYGPSEVEADLEYLEAMRLYREFMQEFFNCYGWPPDLELYKQCNT